MVTRSAPLSVIKPFTASPEMVFIVALPGWIVRV